MAFTERDIKDAHRDEVQDQKPNTECAKRGGNPRGDGMR